MFAKIQFFKKEHLSVLLYFWHMCFIYSPFILHLYVFQLLIVLVEVGMMPLLNLSNKLTIIWPHEAILGSMYVCKNWRLLTKKKTIFFLD